MDLFDYMREDKMEKESPLASRLRPRTLDEIIEGDAKYHEENSDAL